MPRLVHISDTHGMHMGIPLPAGDILIHSGDFGNSGSFIDCVKFFNWFNTHPHKHKVVIAGNHDVWMERANPSELKMVIPDGITYLNEETVEIEGYKFWGSPYTPEFFNWAFNVPRGELHKHWDKIPNDTDVVITHGPPKGFGDECPDFSCKGRYVRVGDEELSTALDRVKPLLHLSGHVHMGYGDTWKNGTFFVNGSICDESYRPVNKPYVIDINGRVVDIVKVY